jgi:TolA-binding protein
MGASLTSQAWSQRLADQLQTLSQVAEALTYRLVDMEERLEEQQRLLQPLLEIQDPAQDQEMDERLEETEERLGRIERLLRGLDSGLGSQRPLASQSGAAAPVRPFAARGLPLIHHDPSLDGSGLMDGADLFIEEGEQPFMDDLVA